jgi:ABC-2 type transport system permease protein
MMTTAESQKPENGGATTTTGRKAAPWGYFFYCELLKILRNPPAVLFGIGFPTMFFLIFGNTFPLAATSTLAGLAAYGAFVVSFQTFSMSLATERALGWNKLLRSTPMTPALYLGTKFLVIIITGVLSLLLLFVVAALNGNVHLSLTTWAALLGMMVVGMIPLSLTGIFLGFVGSANLTNVLATLLGLLLSFGSGLFVPLSIMPAAVQNVAPYLPTYQLGQLAWITVGSSYQDSRPLWLHLFVLVGYAVVFAVLSVWAYTRDENKNFA